MIVIMVSKTHSFYHSVSCDDRQRVTSPYRAIDPRQPYRVSIALACLGT